MLEDLQLTKLMLSIFLLFLLCFLPLMLVNVFDKNIHQPGVHIVAAVLAWTSAAINPVIYTFTHRQYRQAVVRLLCGPGRGRSSGDGGGVGAQRGRVRPDSQSIQSCALSCYSVSSSLSVELTAYRNQGKLTSQPEQITTIGNIYN